MHGDGSRLFGLLAIAMGLGVALAALLAFQLSESTSEQSRPEGPRSAVPTTPVAEAPPPAALEVVPEEAAEPVVELPPAEPDPPAVESPPPPPGMLFVGAGTLLPGLAEAQLKLAVGQCEEDYVRHPELRRGCASKFDAEPPTGPVKVPAFYIDRFEVSQAQWFKCRSAKVCGPMKLHWDLRTQPATGVTHEMATTYCEWRGARLPTEVEWAYTARGPVDPRLYPWGDDPPVTGDKHKTNYGRMGRRRGIPGRADGHKFVAPVDAFAERGASPFGVANLAGNVREWTSTPVGDGFVARGGGWLDVPHNLRVTRREVLPPQTAENELGFRCAVDLPQR